MSKVRKKHGWQQVRLSKRGAGKKKISLELWQSTYLWGLTTLLTNTNNLCRGLVETHTPFAKLYVHARNSHLSYSSWLYVTIITSNPN